jgi:putative addiction module component (TIGR02574 family)
MSPTVQSLGIDRLPREQRIALVLDIWDSIATESGQPLLTDAQSRELERRIAEDDANPDDVVPWEQAKSQTLWRLKPTEGKS